MKTRLKFVRKFIFPLIAVFIFFVFLFPAVENKIFSVHFVDEEDSFVSGKYILKGEKLYSDLVVQHQPLSFLISGQIQKIVRINSLPQLVKRHREFIFIYSFIWANIIVLNFGIWTLGFISILEVTKHFFYGNLFLSESLVVYPFIFLTLLIMYSKKYSERIKLFSLTVGILTTFIALLLLPLWPALIFLIILFFFHNQNKLKSAVCFFCLGFIPLITYVSQFVSWDKYVFDVFIITQKYYLEKLAQTGEKLSLLGFTAPVLSFFWTNIHSPILRIIQSLSLVYLLLSTVLILRKRLFILTVTFVILGLVHIRFVNLEKSFHNGFHLLPWYGLLLMFIFYLFQNLTQNFRRRKIVIFSFYFFIPLFIFLSVKEYFVTRTNRETDAYVNFSRPFDFGEAIRIMKTDNDRLFAIPDYYLIYWQADISHFDSTTSYYPWSESIPSLSSEINTLFETNPPEFFYCDCSELSLKKYFYLYNRMHKDDHETDLYVLKSKSQKISNTQREELDYYRFRLESDKMSEQ